MSNSVFNPFGKELADLHVNDLSRLRDVNEGWFVEYKKQLPEPGKAAKSVAAFANHAGGWLCIGVRSGSDMLRAEACDGLAADDLVRAETSLRDAIKGNISPTPHFECRGLVGPSLDGFVPEGCAVLIVRIPRGSNAPYIHSSGVIYRRIADSSDPKPEHDRAIVDMLFERGRLAVKRLELMLDEMPAPSKGEAEVMYAHVWLLPDPWGDTDSFGGITFTDFSKTVRDDQHWHGMAYDNLFAGSDEYVARMVAGNDPLRRLTSLHHFGDGSTRVTIPINSGALPLDVHRLMGSYKHFDRFLSVARRSKLKDGVVVDVNLLFMLLVDAWRRHVAMAMLGGAPTRVYAKVKLENTWRKIPFFDADAALVFMEQNGIPVMQDSSVVLPRQNNLLPGTFIEIDPPQGDDMFEKSILAGVQMFAEVVEGLGFPRQILEGALEEMDDVCRRAVENMQRLARDGRR